MNYFFNQKNVCPDCSMDIYKHMLMGPEGGGSINVKCSFCGSYFNDMGPFGIERIRWFNHHSIISSKSPPITNYTHFTPAIIQTWISVYVTPRISSDELYAWCEKNCDRQWSVKSGKLQDRRSFWDFDKTTYFFHPNEQDLAALFKLIFG